MAGIAAWLLASAGLASATPSAGLAETPGGAGPWWVSIGVLSGSTRLDRDLADYQWDVTPRMDWGAQTLAGRGRFATGLRVWRTETTQQIDPAAPTTAATVRATSVELLGRARLARALGCELMALTSTGVLHLGYHPDQVTIASAGGGAPIAVGLAPVDAWIGGAGLGLRRPLLRAWTGGLEVEHRRFSLDTAHRNGAAIEYRRQRFGDWSARLELAWASR